MDKKLNVGIGFITGRKNFQRVLRTHALSWQESGVLSKGVALHLFIAYDLTYKNTEKSDYIISDATVQNLVDSAHYLGNSAIREERRQLVARGILTEREAELIFSEGYSGKRNMVLYDAIKSGMDYLIFLDDDEYPMAAVLGEQLCWVGQDVLTTHMRTLPDCDITHGHHCGYVSPIPAMEYSEQLAEQDFRMFIEAVSNDIISWPSIKSKMDSGGVTYADWGVLEDTEARPVEEVHLTKFISGANLGFNLKRPERTFPFYNPPGARGEDAFLSTCLHDRNVQKVPCYTFHDGFSAYPQLLSGTLPARLRPISARSPAVQRRFYQAAVGWIRYKPLLLAITDPGHYPDQIALTREKLSRAVPKLCAHFDNPEFFQILTELDRYTDQIAVHAQDFTDTKGAWQKAIAYLMNCTCSGSDKVFLEGTRRKWGKKSALGTNPGT